MRFIPKEWKDDERLRSKKGAPSLGSIIDFQFFNWPQEVEIILKFVPDDSAKLVKIFNLARQQQRTDGPFVVTGAVSPGYYIPLYRRPILSAERYEQCDLDGSVSEIRAQWTEFVGQDLPRIEEAVRQWNL